MDRGSPENFETGTKKISQIRGDRPKTAIAEDELGYGDFARAIATSLDATVSTDGLVIAVHGPWGSGKTSAVNMILEALKKVELERNASAPTIVAHFNPWWFSEQSDLTKAFFGEMVVALGKQMSSKVKDGLKSIARRVGRANDLVSWAIKLTPAAGLAGPIADGLKSLLEEDEDQTVQELKSKLEKSLRDEQRKVLVIIDDIDRLPSDEARQIFRLVKSLADLPFVTYLLVFDREIASRAMEKPGDPEGPQWIEKIVQASFDLPKVTPTDLHRMLFRGLDAIPGLSARVDRSRWPNMFQRAISPWIKVPRDVERLLNAVELNWPVVGEDVNLEDLVCVETIRLFEPNLLNFIKINESLLTGVPSSGSYQATGIDSLKGKLETLDVGNVDRARKALIEIFPKAKAEFSNQYSSNWVELDRTRRISSERHFDSYFRYGVGDGALSSGQRQRFSNALGDPAAAAEIVAELASTPRSSGGTKAAVLLTEWQVISEDIKTIDAVVAARAFLFFADLFLTEADSDNSAFSVPLSWNVLFVIEPLLKALDDNERKEIVLEAVANGPSLRMVTLLIQHERAAHGQIPEEKARPAEERLFNEIQLAEIVDALSARLIKDAKTGKLLSYGDRWVLGTWREMVGDQKAKRYIKKIITQPEAAASLMRVLTSSGHVSTSESVTKTYRVDSIEAKKWVNLAALKDIAEKMLGNDSTPEQHLIIARNFLKGLERKEDFG